MISIAYGAAGWLYVPHTHAQFTWLGSWQQSEWIQWKAWAFFVLFIETIEIVWFFYVVVLFIIVSHAVNASKKRWMTHCGVEALEEEEEEDDDSMKMKKKKTTNKSNAIYVS